MDKSFTLAHPDRPADASSESQKTKPTENVVVITQMTTGGTHGATRPIDVVVYGSGFKGAATVATRVVPLNNPIGGRTVTVLGTMTDGLQARQTAVSEISPDGARVGVVCIPAEFVQESPPAAEPAIEWNPELHKIRMAVRRSVGLRHAHPRSREPR